LKVAKRPHGPFQLRDQEELGPLLNSQVQQASLPFLLPTSHEEGLEPLPREA